MANKTHLQGLLRQGDTSLDYLHTDRITQKRWRLPYVLLNSIFCLQIQYICILFNTFNTLCFLIDFIGAYVHDK